MGDMILKISLTLGIFGEACLVCDIMSGKTRLLKYYYYYYYIVLLNFLEVLLLFISEIS